MSRLLKNPEDIQYYLYKELPYANKVIDKAIKQYWESIHEAMSDKYGLIDNIKLTNFLALKRNLYADAKKIAKAMNTIESKEWTIRNEEKINELKQQLESIEIQIKKRLYSKRAVIELPED